jgi:seryl-tRNA synthetase
MLQIQFIRQNPEAVKAGLQKKHFSSPETVDTLLQSDEEIRKLKASSEALQASINSLSKEIGRQWLS